MGLLQRRLCRPGQRRHLDGQPGLMLTDWQAAHAATRPDLIHATAHLIADHYEQQGIAGVEVRADAWATMNGREAQRLIDPAIDLAAYDRGRAPPGWILDLS